MFVTSTLSIPSLSPASSSLQEIYQADSSPNTPILMITTAGADPTQELEDYAKREKPGMYKQLAMGGQQTKAAISLLHEAGKSGAWLCLKNLHLVVHWVPQLEKELSSMTPHPDFRLWLTTEQHAHFPTIILQQSLKITFEAPPGLQQNLARTYESQMHKEFVEKGPSSRAQLLFVLSWFHAVLQERHTSRLTTLRVLAGGFTLRRRHYDAVAGGRTASQIGCHPRLLGSTIYGGMSITQDDRLLNTYLQQYFSSAMLGGGSRIQLAPGVALPSSNSHRDYTDLINRLPPQDTPALFGLPVNADVAVQQRAAVHVQDSLRQLSSDPEGAGKFDRDKWAAQLTPILTLWSKLSQQCEP